MVKIIENPVLIRELASFEKPIELIPLPLTERIVSTQGTTGAEGSIIMVCIDGAIRIVDLKTLKPICYGKIEDDEFVSAAYCNSKSCILFYFLLCNSKYLYLLT